MVWCTYKQTPPPLRPALSRRNTLKSRLLISPSDISSVSQVSEMASILNWQVFITFLISSILFISRLTFICAIDKGWYIILWFGLGLGMKGGASGFRLQCVFCGAIAILSDRWCSLWMPSRAHRGFLARWLIGICLPWFPQLRHRPIGYRSCGMASARGKWKRKKVPFFFTAPYISRQSMSWHWSSQNCWRSSTEHSGAIPPT